MNKSKKSHAAKTLEQIAQTVTGKSPECLRAQPITERRREVEAAQKKPTQFVSNFPFVGRGNVMRDRIISHAEVERLLDEALRD